MQLRNRTVDAAVAAVLGEVCKAEVQLISDERPLAAEVGTLRHWPNGPISIWVWTTSYELLFKPDNTALLSCPCNTHLPCIYHSKAASQTFQNLHFLQPCLAHPLLEKRPPRPFPSRNLETRLQITDSLCRCTQFCDPGSWGISRDSLQYCFLGQKCSRTPK
ncbi:hypothetical protein P154DRAFT_18424 [Amniculicola lignicola CBS 123094]|uniref:Uncharacterized protein n=1 Tax=Amniculicola lignicola CBS 123094 TaxID=1392246 RepID=A0A6A5X5G0_9PLEO|nr:hypothetical protein P154DRAFT_18424 [Amniculicola lignicola CBS 123094]